MPRLFVPQLLAPVPCATAAETLEVEVSGVAVHGVACGPPTTRVRPNTDGLPKAEVQAWRFRVEVRQ